ncbi:MAG: glutamate racemase [Alphaproteobacteria bacterium]|nr:glutamate racemase [Alphaproteobacteria bacterium]
MKIGVFDSGLGGLVVTKAFIDKMPEYDYVYYGDTANLPYGEKTSEQILSYTVAAIKFLVSQNCGLIVVACNTATAIALRFLQQQFMPFFAPDVKVLGVVIPTVEEALSYNAKKVGVISTRATTSSMIYRQELLKINSELEIREIASPELVPAIEGNDFAEAKKISEQYAKKFEDMDSLILGCTHYPLVKNMFRECLPQVRIISQDELMGDKLKDYLQRHIEIDICLSRNSDYKFLVSEWNGAYQKVASTLFPDIPIKKVEQNV